MKKPLFRLFLEVFIISIALQAIIRSESRAECEDANRFVKAESKWLTGLGHCEKELVLYLTNNSNQRVVCHFGAERTDGTWQGGETGIRSGKKVGGELSGMWFCGATGRYKWACQTQPDPAKDWNCKWQD